MPSSKKWSPYSSLTFCCLLASKSVSMQVSALPKHNSDLYWIFEELLCKGFCWYPHELQSILDRNNLLAREYLHSNFFVINGTESLVVTRFRRELSLLTKEKLLQQVIRSLAKVVWGAFTTRLQVLIFVILG